MRLATEKSGSREVPPLTWLVYMKEKEEKRREKLKVLHLHYDPLFHLGNYFFDEVHEEAG